MRDQPPVATKLPHMCNSFTPPPTPGAWGGKRNELSVGGLILTLIARVPRHGSGEGVIVRSEMGGLVMGEEGRDRGKFGWFGTGHQRSARKPNRLCPGVPPHTYATSHSRVRHASFSLRQWRSRPVIGTSKHRSHMFVPSRFTGGFFFIWEFSQRVWHSLDANRL